MAWEMILGPQQMVLVKVQLIVGVKLGRGGAEVGKCGAGAFEPAFVWTAVVAPGAFSLASARLISPQSTRIACQSMMLPGGRMVTQIPGW